MTIETKKYAGADHQEWRWQRDGITPSPFGRQVADILGQVWRGIYHMDDRAIERADWANKHSIRVNIYGSLDTYDFDYLTRLVILCHDHCIRLEIIPSGPRGLGLCFSARTCRRGSVSRRHPTMETAIANCRAENNGCITERPIADEEVAT